MKRDDDRTDSRARLTAQCEKGPTAGYRSRDDFVQSIVLAVADSASRTDDPASALVVCDCLAATCFLHDQSDAARRALTLKRRSGYMPTVQRLSCTECLGVKEVGFGRPSARPCHTVDRLKGSMPIGALTL